ncbi:separin protein, variant 2 [Mucor circinelloides]
MILLILAYQMNAIRCWCELQEGALAKYIPYFMEKSGNFFDWCVQLLNVDATTAKKQLDTLQKLLYKVANKLPLTEEAAHHSHSIQIIALKALATSGSVPMKLVLDRLVRIGITYEKSTKQTSYSHLEKCCNGFLEQFQPNVNNLAEMDSYFVLCEYFAYVSRKAKSYKGAFYAYKYMIRPLRDMMDSASSCSFYYAAYAANAKLALGSVQMDKMVLNDTFADITTTLNESIACLALIKPSADQPQDDHLEQALYNLCKSIEGFRLSCKRLFEFISDKTKQALIQRKNEPFKTPPRQEELVTPSDFGQWNTVVAYMKNVLQQCSETLRTTVCIAKVTSDTKRSTTQEDIMISYIDIMVLLARIQFNIKDEDSYAQAYDHLTNAEEMCADKKYPSGYRWLSGSYYNLGTALIKTDMYAQAIFPLRKSSSLLEKDTERANTNEGRLQLCKRYEVLGICCQKTKRFEDAISAFRLALKRIPVSEIEKFVSKADTTAVSTVMEQETLIPKLIDRFLRASVIDPDQESIQFASEHINLSTINSVQKCFIYECELKVWHALSVKMKLFKYELFIMERLLQVYDAEHFPLRRARVLLSQVKIERNKPSDRDECTKAALACAKEASSLLKVQDYAQDTNLLNYRRHYLALSNSWMAICGRELKEPSPNTFTSTLQQWGILLKKIKPIYYSGDSSKLDVKQVYDEIDDLDQFYDHMRMLADLFGITGERIHQICALRILLKLNNGLRDAQVDHISESIILSSTIGKLYCELGYTGKAAIEFIHAKKAVSSKPCNNHAELVYLVNYSYYLACIGDYDTSMEVFTSAKFVWKNTPAVDHRDPLTTVKSYTTRCMLLADIYSTLSLIQANTEDVDSAIDSATASLQLLNKCIQIVQKSQEKEQQKQKTELEDPFNSPPPEQQEARKIVFRESQWTMAQKISSSLHTLAQLLVKKGSPNEAKYFVKQAPLLAEKVNSSAMLFDAHLNACEFYLRFGDVDKSQDEIQMAVRYKEPTGLAQVKYKVALAKLAVANAYFEIAVESYDEANEQLAQLSDKQEIAALERLIDSNEERKRDKVTFADEADDSDKYDCYPLQQLIISNEIYKAMALADLGRIEDGLELLDSFDLSTLSASNEIELIATVGHLRLRMIRQDSAMRPEQRLLFSETVASPAMKSQVSRGSLLKKPAMDHELRAMRDALGQSLNHMYEAYRNGWTRERPVTMENLCRETSYATILNQQLSINNSMAASDNSLRSSYYMSMANGINMRREMQYCLGIKLNQTFAGHAPSDKEWPMNTEEKQSHYDRLSRMSRNPGWLQGHLKTLQDLYQEESELGDTSFQAKFVDILPINWTVCSLSLDVVNSDLYLVQLRAKEQPFAVKLPLNRASQRPSDEATEDTVQYSDAVNELRAIIQGSDETITNSANCHQAGEIEHWWNTRKSLDARLKKLLDNMENQWLSGFKGLLTGRCQEYKEELVKFQKAMNEIIFKTVNSVTTTKLKVELSLAFSRAAVRLGRNPAQRDLEDVAYFALSCYEAQNISIDYTKIDFKKLTEHIRLLIARYHERSVMAGVDSTKNIPNDHVILILDKHLQMFPIESMPALRPQSVSRLPCLSFLRDRILYTQFHNSKEAYDDFGLTATSEWTDLTVSKRSAFYVLNPGGDLKDTQREFEPIFKSVPEWDGVIESMPMELQCKDALQSRDIYMYFGHSAGQAFMRGTTVRQLPNCAVSLLMGCSSGIMEANGEFDLNGYVLNYLLAGSPAVVANLWDVTDRSIDKLTKYMLHSWGMLNKSNETPKSLVQAVSESRNQCKLGYLIGAAPVVYGIPVYLNNTK